MQAKLLSLAVVLAVFSAVTVEAATIYILDDADFRTGRQLEPDPESLALRRPVGGPVFVGDSPSDPIDRADGYGHHGGYKEGTVGPVYTFVKTDPYAHVKWGVRHVAGKKYAGH